MNQQEFWRPIINFEGKYEISNLGRVRNMKTGRILKHFLSSGYPCVELWDSWIRTSKRIHVLLAETFIGERPPRHEVDHIDGDKLNFSLENLEYVSPRTNNTRARKLGLINTTWPGIRQARLNKELKN